jgi:hypothetical protein
MAYMLDLQHFHGILEHQMGVMHQDVNPTQQKFIDKLYIFDLYLKQLLRYHMIK